VLVQSERCLVAYSAKSLLDEPSKPVKSWEIDNSHEVVFFRVHHTKGQIILAVAVFHQGVQEVHIYDGLSLKLKSGFRSQKVQVKRLQEKECGFQEPLRDLLFARIGVTPKGFRFLNDKPKTPTSPGGIKGRESVILPQPTDTQVKLLQRCQSAKPLSMHPIGKQNILCFDDFGVFINSDSGKLSGKSAEWECRPALNVIWRPPHFILVSSRCLEVRDMATGALLQLIVGPTGQELVCDGRGVPDDLEGLSVLLTSPNEEGRKKLWTLNLAA